MASSIYTVEIVKTINGDEFEASPLKIKYLRLFMDAFLKVKESSSDYEAIGKISECVLVAMKQYLPTIKTLEDVEDSFDLKTMYQVMNIAANIKMGTESEKYDQVVEQAQGQSSTWEDLDLAKLETEVFLTGIWKNYEELESSLSMPELFATLESKRDLDYTEKKFLAAMQGVDLDEQSGKKDEDPWEALKARVASNGVTDDPNDILGYQGIRAAQAGFGIGMGLDYSTEI